MHKAVIIQTMIKLNKKNTLKNTKKRLQEQAQNEYGYLSEEKYRRHRHKNTSEKDKNKKKIEKINNSSKIELKEIYFFLYIVNFIIQKIKY